MSFEIMQFNPYTRRQGQTPGKEVAHGFLWGRHMEDMHPVKEQYDLPCTNCPNVDILPLYHLLYLMYLFA